MLKQQRAPQGSQKKVKQPVEGLFCNYPHRTCMHNRVEGYEFCTRHLLEDKNAPFKQCSFVSGKSGKRCPNAAPKADRKDGYCTEHARKAMLVRQKSARKPRQKETAESLLEELDHFKTDIYPDNRRSRLNTDSVASKVLDYASSSDSDAEPATVDKAWRGDMDSDAESVDSDQEDLLKYAGIYTAEEVALVMRDKLIRLQSLYIDQFKRLQHIMQEKRRKYLHTHKREKETYGSLAWYKERPDTRDKYTKLKCSKRYHKRHGREALLHRQSKQRRIAMSEGTNYRPPSYPKCLYQDDSNSNKCPQRAVPLSKYCSQHILTDPYQVLYRSCQFGNGACSKPVISRDDDAYCRIHTLLDETTIRYPLKQEETDEELDVDRDDILDKEALLNSLDALGNRDNTLLAHHLLSKNPELPESIFSTDTTEDEMLMQSSGIGNDAKHACSSEDLDVLNSERPDTSVENSLTGLCTTDQTSQHFTQPLADDKDEQKLSAYGPLLLQHLQGKVDLSSLRVKRKVNPPSSPSSASSPSSMSSVSSPMPSQPAATISVTMMTQPPNESPSSTVSTTVPSSVPIQFSVVSSATEADLSAISPSSMIITLTPSTNISTIPDASNTHCNSETHQTQTPE